MNHTSTENASPKHVIGRIFSACLISVEPQQRCTRLQLLWYIFSLAIINKSTISENSKGFIVANLIQFLAALTCLQRMFASINHANALRILNLIRIKTYCYFM